MECEPEDWLFQLDGKECPATEPWFRVTANEFLFD